MGIPVFREVSYLDECLKSILEQETQPVEILIVDDGSASAEVGATLDDLAGKDSRVRLLTTEHRGVCAARNTLMAEMTGDSFLLVDADDYLEREFITRCSTMLRSDDRLWGVATWTRFFGGYEGVEAKPPFDARVGSRENPIVSTAVLLDMEVREHGIRFEPDLAFLFCEDWNLWSQIVAAGGMIGLVPEALTNHRVHRASGGYLRTDLAYAIGKARATDPLTS